ncbi:uncharacterized protein [Dermacentor andersoni]|uniref:uncharacterized protein n=1 Tax=Dermacentor andersoni TaxID=34620 RepID=UPI003B3BD77C
MYGKIKSSLVGIPENDFGFLLFGLACVEVLKAFFLKFVNELFMGILEEVCYLDLLLARPLEPRLDLCLVPVLEALDHYLGALTGVLCADALSDLNLSLGKLLWTQVDADDVTTEQRVKLVAVWVPVIIIAAMCKIYYTILLYKFYRTYKDTNGRAFDGAPKAAAKSVQAEGDRTFIARTPDDVTAQNISKSMEGTILTTKSQTVGVKSRRQSVGAEDQTTAIQSRGSKSRKSGDRSRRQSVTAGDRTTTVLPPKTKSGKLGDRSRRQSVTAGDRTTTVLPPKTKSGKLGDRSRRQSVDEGTTTILPAGKNYGKFGGHSRRQSAASETRRDVATLLGDMSKGQAVSANRRGTTGAATTTRKPAIRESRRPSVFAAAGAQKDGKKSQRLSGTATADASAMTETTRKKAPRSRRQSVAAEGDDTQRLSTAGSTPPLQTSRRQSVAAIAALAAAQLAAQDRARRKRLTGADSTGVGATSTPKKST